MSDEQAATETGELIVIAAQDVKPEDMGMLALHYRDGVAVLVAAGGSGFPATIQLVDSSGKPIANYVASGQAPKPEVKSGTFDQVVFVQPPSYG